MAEAEEQPPASPQNEGRSEGGEEAPDGGAAAGAADPAPPPAASPGTEEPAGDTKKKIDILLKAVGDTPIMKTKKWAVERTRTIQGLVDFIKKFLKLMASEQLLEIMKGFFFPRLNVSKKSNSSVHICKPVFCSISRPRSWDPV
ncbi:ubiquitin-like protein ATG12 isoform 1-T1 [Spheniscus humboldti]